MQVENLISKDSITTIKQYEGKVPRLMLLGILVLVWILVGGIFLFGEGFQGAIIFIHAANISIALCYLIAAFFDLKYPTIIHKFKPFQAEVIKADCSAIVVKTANGEELSIDNNWIKKHQIQSTIDKHILQITGSTENPCLTLLIPSRLVGQTQ